MKKVIVLVLGCVFFFSCEKVTYYPDAPINFTGTLQMAHRGGGNDTLRENTYESFTNAVQFMDGVETDIQISKDRTIWLSHSSDVMNCSGTINCFVETHDAVIEAITLCNSNEIRYTRLEEVLKYMNDNNIKKYVSLDFKGWIPCSANTLDIEGVMRLATEEIITLGERYNLTEYLIIETNVVSVLTWAKKKNNKINVYLTSYGDYEKAMLQSLKNNLDGISYKAYYGDELTADMMNLLHKKGLRLMAWNIPDSISAQQLESIQVDILQVDL